MYVCIHACAHTHTHTCNNVLIQFSWYSAFLFTRRKVFLTRYTILGLCIWFLLVFVIWTNFGGYFLILSRIFAQFVRGDLKQTINTSDNCKWWLSLREDTSLLPAKDRNNTRACVFNFNYFCHEPLGLIHQFAIGFALFFVRNCTLNVDQY